MEVETGTEMKNKATKKKVAKKQSDIALEKLGLDPAINYIQYCDGCLYSRRMQADEALMYCHRNPLIVRVGVSHWCGEFKTES